MKKLFFIFATTFLLQGCIFVAGAAAGAAAIAVVYDHRKLEQVVQDQRIANTSADQVKNNPTLRENTHVSITSFNQTVLLTGQAISPEYRQQAEQAVQANVPGIKRIYNEITIQGPTSSLTRASDSWITTKIKTQMLATKDLKSGTIKVITENGAVFLMGMVSHEQADNAVAIARQVAGVQKVMKIFQYTD